MPLCINVTSAECGKGSFGVTAPGRVPLALGLTRLTFPPRAPLSLTPLVLQSLLGFFSPACLSRTTEATLLVFPHPICGRGLLVIVLTPPRLSVRRCYCLPRGTWWDRPLPGILSAHPLSEGQWWTLGVSFMLRVSCSSSMCRPTSLTPLTSRNNRYFSQRVEVCFG